MVGYATIGAIDKVPVSAGTTKHPLARF